MQDSHALATLGFSPHGLFESFPYLVTRVVPAMYHIIVLPNELHADSLIEISRRQARANRLPTCLVSSSVSALYMAPDGREYEHAPPRGGIVVANRLRPCRTFAKTQSLVARQSALQRYIDGATPRSGYTFGDLTKGGRPATLEENVMLAGRQPNGVPRGLVQCGRCAEWQGRCLDPSPKFTGHVMDVDCRCANDNRCAACCRLLHGRKLNANHYNEVDRHIWHTPGFSGFSHACAAGTPQR
jgi:hypothetical protein